MRNHRRAMDRRRRAKPPEHGRHPAHHRRLACRSLHPVACRLHPVHHARYRRYPRQWRCCSRLRRLPPKWPMPRAPPAMPASRRCRLSLPHRQPCRYAPKPARMRRHPAGRPNRRTSRRQPITRSPQQPTRRVHRPMPTCCPGCCCWRSPLYCSRGGHRCGAAGNWRRKPSASRASSATLNPRIPTCSRNHDNCSNYRCTTRSPARSTGRHLQIGRAHV